MVWFQCESCGENLKKPKLLNHFRGCAARKLSCIDCGVVFDQQSVQVHTSCVSETEKYGPKDGSNGSAQKPKSSQASKPGDFDLSLGLSTQAPWNCSLCKVSATSYETLEGHSQGKKHRAKAKAAHARLNPVAAENPLQNGSQAKPTAEKNGSELAEDVKSSPPLKEEDGSLKKRKKGDEVEKKSAEKKKKSSKEEGTVNGGGDKVEVEKAANGKPIKWKKLTTKVLLNAPEKRMKIKELSKELLPLVTVGAINSDKTTLEKQLTKTLKASSKFEVNGKYVALVTSS